MRRNIVPAVAGALADVHHANRPPPDAQIDNALRQALTQLDIDVRTPPWISTSTRDARRPASTLLAFYDSESRILRIANTSSAGRACLGRRRVGNHGYECRELTSSISVSGGVHLDPVQPSPGQARMNIDEAFEEFPSRGLTSRDSAAPVVEVQSVEVHDGDFLVLGSDITWACLAGDEVVQAVGMWMREQEGTMPVVPEKSLLDVPWQKEHDFVLDTMVPRMIRDINEMFVGLQGNAASRVLRQLGLARHRGKKGSDQQDQSVLVRSDDSCSAYVVHQRNVVLLSY
jgi:serine/threonine protein phosphatase PrpC